MSASVLLIVIGVLLALAVYSVRETIAQETKAKRDARILGLALASLIGIIPMGLIQTLALTSSGVTFWESAPFGLIIGVAAYEVGPAVKKAALKILGRKSETVSTLTTTLEKPNGP